MYHEEKTWFGIKSSMLDQTKESIYLPNEGYPTLVVLGVTDLAGICWDHAGSEPQIPQDFPNILD